MHFDCIYGAITAVSSRESKLLAGNRIIAQVDISTHVFHSLRAYRETLGVGLECRYP